MLNELDPDDETQNPLVQEVGEMAVGSVPFGLILLGLTLGMRHATDPDHVIAVTAILTRERPRLRSALHSC
jgi:high-affinity nickel permease